MIYANNIKKRNYKLKLAGFKIFTQKRNFEIDMITLTNKEKINAYHFNDNRLKKKI